MAELTFNVLWEILNYDFETGKLYWRERSVKWFKNKHDCHRWNIRWANKEASTSNPETDLYKKITIFYKSYKEHQIIWFMCFGKWPTNQIDHIDGNTHNNKITNFRIVTNLENSKNKCKPKNNKSGVIGVSWYKYTNKWCAFINVNKKRIYLGYFTEFQEAVQHRKQAETKFKYHPNHGREKSLPT